MRWPFGPPHLTLKPSNKKNTKTQKHKNTKTNKKTKKQKRNKNKIKKEAQKKLQNYQKIAFQLSVNFFLFWVAFQNFPFLHLGPKNLNPKNTIKIGVLGPFFLKSCCASRNGHFWTKKPKIYKFQLSFFFAYFLLFQKQKTQKSAETPIFILFLLT